VFGAAAFGAAAFGGQAMSRHHFDPRSDYADIVPYGADRAGVEINLADNTNQWGVAPSALRALAEWTSRDIQEYPPTDSRELAEAFAAYVSVPLDCVVAGCGSDDLLDASFRALAAPGARVAHPLPTFAMIPVLARTNSLVPIAVPVTDRGDVDADALIATGAEVMYLCSPNNPTGTPHSRASIERVIRDAPGVVILDEAYAEYADDVFSAEAIRYPHVFVTRTLSKSFGLAGLRVGFGVGSPTLIHEVLKARGPYKVNSMAERAATAALRHDLAWMRNIASAVRAVRARVVDALRELGLEALPSAANFVCVPVADAKAIANAVRARGVAIRPMSLPHLGDVLRIGLAPWPSMERALDAIADAVASVPGSG
jgi:histidinol-phosphate aminotransferase